MGDIRGFCLMLPASGSAVIAKRWMPVIVVADGPVICGDASKYVDSEDYLRGLPQHGI